MTDQHKRSGKRVRRSQKSIDKHIANRRTPEDHKRLKERARRRRAEGRGPRRRDWDAADDVPETFESMRRKGDDVFPRDRRAGSAAGASGASGASAGSTDPASSDGPGPESGDDRQPASSAGALRDAAEVSSAGVAGPGRSPASPRGDAASGGREPVPIDGDTTVPGGADPTAVAAPGDVGTASADGSTTLGGGAGADPPGTARVLGLSRGRAQLLADGRELDAVLSGALQAVQQTALAVGDVVRWEGDGERPRVVEVLPRRSELARPDPGNPHRRRVLAANVDVVVLVLSVRRPRLRLGLVDRFLVALHGADVTPLVVLNKVDLLEDEAARDALDRAVAPFRELGVTCLAASAADGVGLEALAAQLAGRAAVFVGHSGVGKSSLLNGLDPAGRRRTHGGRDGDGKGRHTTTASTLTELAGGTTVIDTPGVRAFGLWDVERADLRLAFPEFVARQGDCRFSDCSHLVEPACAVRAAVESGDIAVTRWEAYQRIHASLER